MSHFALTVALPAAIRADEGDLRAVLVRRLAPFGAGLEVERYRAYTREELIAKERAEIEEYENTTYAHYLADPEGYMSRYFTVRHMAYLRDEFPKRLTWSDEQVYQHATRLYEAKDIGPQGEVYSTVNPYARWDWWVVGGRWSGRWAFSREVNYPRLAAETPSTGPLSTDCGRLEDITPESLARERSLAYLDLDGHWHESPEPGWVVVNDDLSDPWLGQYDDWIRSLDPRTWLVKVDCHI